MNQPGKIANPARVQLNREKIFLCPRAWLIIWSSETGSAFPSRVSLLISVLRLNLVLTGFLPSYVAASIYVTAIRHRVSPEFIVSRNCVPMAFTAESPPAQSGHVESAGG